MPRKFMSVLIVLMIALSIAPASSLAAATAAPAASIATPDFSKTPDKKALDKIKASMLPLVKDRPTGGKVVKISALEKTLAPYRAKYKPGSGNSFYMVSFNGDYIKQNGKWALGETANVSASWVQNATTFTRMESMIVKGLEEDRKEGTIDCTLMKSDKNFSYIYNWEKFTKTGQLMKIPKMPSLTENNSTITDDKNETARIYPNQTVSGQLCKVYSYGSGKDEIFYWLSTTKGFEIKTAYFLSATDQSMTYTYEMKKLNKDASFYNPPTDVKFTEDSMDEIQLDPVDESSDILEDAFDMSDIEASE